MYDTLGQQRERDSTCAWRDPCTAFAVQVARARCMMIPCTRPLDGEPNAIVPARGVILVQSFRLFALAGQNELMILCKRKTSIALRFIVHVLVPIRSVNRRLQICTLQLFCARCGGAALQLHGTV